VTAPEPAGKKPAGPARYAGLGIQFAACVLLFVFVGKWVDGRLHTLPLFTLLGAFLGFGGAMWSMIRQLSRDSDQQSKP
jgi:F0F1-type ATP synthase assembly protein I